MLQSRKKVEIAVFLETTLLAVGYKCEFSSFFPRPMEVYSNSVKIAYTVILQHSSDFRKRFVRAQKEFRSIPPASS